MDVVALSSAVVGHHYGTRFLSVVEMAGISRLSLWELQFSESSRVRTTTLDFGRNTIPASLEELIAERVPC